MKTSLTLGLAALLLTTAIASASPDADALQSKTKAVWQAFQAKSPNDFKKLCAPNYTAVYAEGIVTVDKDLEMMKKVDLRSFDMHDAKVTMWDADTALVAYTMKVAASMDGQDISGDLNCGTVWHKTGSDWLVVLHTEIKAEAAPERASK